VRKRLRFFTHYRGFLALLSFSILLYLLPAPCIYPITGRVTSATSNIASFFQPRQDKEEETPRLRQLRRELVLTQQDLTATRNELHLVRKELESVTSVKSATSGGFAKIIPARIVLSRDASNFRRTVLVNRGSRDGVKPGLLVLWGSETPAAGGLRACVVGVVNTVGPSACRVLLVSDPGFRAAARLLQSRDRVVVEGTSAGKWPMRLKHPAIETCVEPGDTVITSGTLGVFPAGFLIGTVADIQGREYPGQMQVFIESPLDLDRLESVIIVEIQKPESE